MKLTANIRAPGARPQDHVFALIVEKAKAGDKYYRERIEKDLGRSAKHWLRVIKKLRGDDLDEALAEWGLLFARRFDKVPEHRGLALGFAVFLAMEAYSVWVGKASRASHMQLTSDAEEVLQAADDVEREAEEHELLGATCAHLALILRQLSQNDQDALLDYLRDKPVAQVAEETGRTVEGEKTRRKRAKQRAKRAFSGLSKPDQDKLVELLRDSPFTRAGVGIAVVGVLAKCPPPSQFVLQT